VRKKERRAERKKLRLGRWEGGSDWKLEGGKNRRCEVGKMGRWAGKSIAQRAERIVYCE